MFTEQNLDPRTIAKLKQQGPTVASRNIQFSNPLELPKKSKQRPDLVGVLPEITPKGETKLVDLRRIPSGAHVFGTNWWFDKQCLMLEVLSLHTRHTHTHTDRHVR